MLTNLPIVLKFRLLLSMGWLILDIGKESPRGPCLDGRPKCLKCISPIDVIINLDRTPYTAEVRHLIVGRRNVIGRCRSNDAIIDLLSIIQVFCSQLDQF